MSKVREVFKELGEVERRLRITERKLYRLKEDSWSYTKNTLRFGFASWVFGLSIFFLVIVAMSTELFGGAPLTWSSLLVGIPLLVGAPAAPMMMTAASVRKFDTKIKRLRRIRSGLAEVPEVPLPVPDGLPSTFEAPGVEGMRSKRKFEPSDGLTKEVLEKIRET